MSTKNKQNVIISYSNVLTELKTALKRKAKPQSEVRQDDLVNIPPAPKMQENIDGKSELKDTRDRFREKYSGVVDTLNKFYANRPPMNSVSIDSKSSVSNKNTSSGVGIPHAPKMQGDIDENRLDKNSMGGGFDKKHSDVIVDLFNRYIERVDLLIGLLDNKSNVPKKNISSVVNIPPAPKMQENIDENQLGQKSTCKGIKDKRAEVEDLDKRKNTILDDDDDDDDYVHIDDDDDDDNDYVDVGVDVDVEDNDVDVSVSTKALNSSGSKSGGLKVSVRCTNKNGFDVQVSSKFITKRNSNLAEKYGGVINKLSEFYLNRKK